MKDLEIIQNNMYIIGQAVKKKRKAMHWSQEYLGFKAGLDRTYIGGLERGERNATIGTLTNVSEALGTTIFDLMKEAEIVGQQNSNQC